MSPDARRRSVAPFRARPLQDRLRATARRLPQKVAVIEGERRFTFGQLDRDSDRLAAALEGLGVRKGDRVALFSPNCAEFVLAFFGAIKAGAAVTTVNAAYRQREVAHQIGDAQPKLLIAHESLMPVVEEARSEVRGFPRPIVIGEPPQGAASFWGLVEGSRGSPPAPPIDPQNDLVALPYSSGTTGLAKGVMLTHHNVTSNLDQFLALRDEGCAPAEQDVILVHLPLFHIYGLNVLMNAAICAGATQVLMGRFEMELFLQLLSRHRVTMLFTVPPVVLGLTQYPRLGQYDLSALRMCLSGAAPLSADLQGRLEALLGTPVVQGYGLTETSPVTNADFLDRQRRRVGSVGPPLPDTEEKVMDLASGASEAPRGEVGELLIRGPQVMRGYLNNPEATARAIDAEGWLHTGDIARIDHEGYVWIADRKKELIKYKGFQVAPAELEALLLEHPAVADVAVIGKADPDAGEVPKAFVALKKGASATADELAGFVAGKVATFKRVREIEFLDAVPRSPSGKILRRVLVERERARAGR